MENDSRRKAKGKLNRCHENDRDRPVKEYYEKVYEVKKMTWQDKRKWVNTLPRKAQETAHKRNAKQLYRIIRQLSNKGFICKRPVKNKKGELIMNRIGKLVRSKEYFEEVINPKGNGN
jgi:hypothetical protein